MTLVGYWPLNENSGEALDHSGNENHGSLNGGVRQAAKGLLGSSAYDFDGTDGNVQHSYTTSVSFSVSVWIKSDSSTWSSSGCGWADRSSSGFILHPDDGQSTWTGYVLANSSNDYYRIAEASIDDITEWHMYTITHGNETNTSRMFLDGRKVAAASTTTDRVESTNTATIGHDDVDDYNEGERPIDGKISEARYYSRPLTKSEIQYLYSVGSKGLQTTSKKSS